MSNMVVNTNVAALDSHRNMKKVGTAQFTAAARLSSGLRINSAADDAAGLAISEKMRSQIRGLDMASKNAQDAISLIQTAEGGMQEIDNMIQRMRELIVYASNDTLDNGSQSDGSVDTKQGDRRKIQDELDQLATEIDSMANRVEFNKKKLINGDFSGEGAGSLIELDRAAHTTVSTMQSTLDAIKRLIDFGDDRESFDTSKIADAKGGALFSLYDDITKPGGAPIGAALAAMTTALRTEMIDALKDLVGKITVTGVPATDTANLNSVLAEMIASVGKVFGAQNFDDAAVAASITANASAMNALISALSTVAGNTTLQGLASAMTSVNTQLVDGNAKASFSKGGSLYFQIGANKDQGMLGSIGSVTTKALGLGDGKGTDVSATTKLDDNIEGMDGIAITKLLDKYDNALTKVTTERAKLGAYQNRLEYTIKSLDVSSENLSASESRIRDADMGKEMMNLTKANVLQQAATSMLAQNNQNPQMILQLLR